jgi:hypothetical protein
VASTIENNNYSCMKNKKIAILQSNYIPWKGYFDIINSVDEFIIYDDMQFTKRDWRNRNIIKTQNGLKWLSVPVEVKGKYFQKINETKISDIKWAEKHWSTIVHSYSKAKHFAEYKNAFESAYLSSNETFLSEINIKFLYLICNILGIKTPMKLSSEFQLCEGKTERLVNICKQANATEYLTGSSAKNYLDETIFEENNIKVTWMDYSGYPTYNQLFPPFEHGVTILDLIFNEGPDAPKYLKSNFYK